MEEKIKDWAYKNPDKFKEIVNEMGGFVAIEEYTAMLNKNTTAIKQYQEQLKQYQNIKTIHF